MGKKRSNPKTLDAVELSAPLRSGPGPSADNFSTDNELGLLKKLSMVTTRRGGRDIVYESSHPDGAGVRHYPAADIRQIAFIEKFAKLNDPVLITGPTGTGKEDRAKLIHAISPRQKKAFVPVNCGGIHVETLISQMFGHVKGAFTGAIKDQEGAVDVAQGGTLFLDEIGDMQALAQAKLLRFLNDGTYQRFGAMGKDRKADVRIICATNKDLSKMVRQEGFREDLYYRINVFSLTLPPMSIKALISKEHPERSFEEYFRRFAVEGGLVRSKDNKQDPKLPDKWTFKLPRMTPAAIKVLIGYHFPGNYRELSNILKYAFSSCDGTTIKKSDLPDYVLSSRSEATGGNLSSLPPCEFLQAVNRQICERLEKEVQDEGSILAASRTFGMTHPRYKRLLDRSRRGEVI